MAIVTCLCAAPRSDTAEPDVETLATVREHCPVLRKLLAPNDIWPAIVADASAPNDASHRSYLLLAYERGCLARITGPVHKLLFDGSALRSSLTKQYRRDLSEHWLLATDKVARHERFRRFLGKLVELQVANWLVDRGWRIMELEALGSEYDVVGFSPEQILHSFEVKYIGQTTDDFLSICGALAGGSAALWTSVYGSVNYLVFRVYEAAKKLRRSSGLKSVVVVIDAQAWCAFDRQLKERWLNWDAPSFLQTTETDWNQFLEQQREAYPAIDSELSDVFRELKSVWVLRLNSGYEYSLEYEYRPAG